MKEFTQEVPMSEVQERNKRYKHQQILATLVELVLDWAPGCQAELDTNFVVQEVNWLERENLGFLTHLFISKDVEEGYGGTHL